MIEDVPRIVRTPIPLSEVGDAWIEFDSMINVRPSVNNRTRGVDDPATQARIRQVVDSLIVR